MAERAEMSRSFGAAAEAYEAGRPDYPAAAVEWLLQPALAADHASASAGTAHHALEADRDADRTLRVADVGAGTGKLTRVVAEVGADVVAVDPDPLMLEALRAHVAGVPTFEGTAERLPLADEAVDAVLMGQAWHWVDPQLASREIARVLPPGGVLGLVWNIRDDSIDWVRRMTDVMTPSNAEQLLAAGGPVPGPEFEGFEHRTWRWSRPMNRASLLAMARSRSYVITAAPEVRARVEEGLAELLDEIGAVGEAVIDLPYVTEAFRAVRR